MSSVAGRLRVGLVTLGVVQLLAAHVLATVVGAGTWARASRLGEVLADLSRLVVPRMPRRTVLSADRVLALPVPALASSGDGGPLVRGLSRRGPPVVCAG